jgi:hypothetical protein
MRVVFGKNCHAPPVLTYWQFIIILPFHWNLCSENVEKELNLVINKSPSVVLYY